LVCWSCLFLLGLACFGPHPTTMREIDMARILVACEYSGTVRDAFRRLGHDAISCDILPTDVEGPHFQGDVREILNQGWDLMIAHPPCTYLTNSGVRWLHTDESRWDKLKEGADFFKTLLNASIPRICIENPIMHKHAKELIGQDKTQIIQPWMFGHMEQKATCLWLKNLPPLKPTNDVKEQMKALSVKERNRIHYLPPSADRWKIRSTTFLGIADAMAQQWHEVLKEV